MAERSLEEINKINIYYTCKSFALSRLPDHKTRKLENKNLHIGEIISQSHEDITCFHFKKPSRLIPYQNKFSDKAINLVIRKISKRHILTTDLLRISVLYGFAF